MISIFISHSWAESESYFEFVSLLNDVLGKESWKNISIPQNEAIKLSEYENNRSEIESINDQILSLKAKLRLPDLPDAVTRTVWDANGNRKEVETKGLILEKLSSLVSRKEHIEARYPCKDENFVLSSKGVARSLAIHPIIGNAIRHKIMESNIIFVLITPMLLFREWISYEIECAKDSKVIIAGVLSGDIERQNINNMYFDRLVEWNDHQVRQVISSVV